jgi:hypothetical protein
LGVEIELAKKRERKWRERFNLSAGLDDRETRAMADEQARRRARAGDGDADVQPAIGRRAAHFLGNRARVAEEPRHAAQIEHDLAGTAGVDPR